MKLTEAQIKRIVEKELIKENLKENMTANNMKTLMDVYFTLEDHVVGELLSIVDDEERANYKDSKFFEEMRKLYDMATNLKREMAISLERRYIE